MADPFLAAGNIGIKRHVCRFTIVLELAYQHVSKVGDLCYFLDFLKGGVGVRGNWKLVQHSGPL
eukprot:13032148-Ditylum_brightwellii.AAC.1